MIRKATLEDVPQLAHFQVAMALESEDMVLDYNTVKRGIEAIIADPSCKGQYYVVSTDKTALEPSLKGCLLITREWSDWRCKWVWWIQSVYVAQAYRRQGIYRSLYAYIKQLVMDDPGIGGIRLYADKHNTRAIETYRALGMTDEHYATFEWMK